MIYAINKRTKEHIDVTDMHKPFVANYINRDKWHLVGADDDGWIKWNGGGCPLPDGTPYETKHASGDMFEGGNPETFMSHWRGYADAVVAYRPILDEPSEPEEKEKEWSEGLPPVGEVCEVSIGGLWHPCTILAHKDHGRDLVACMTEDYRLLWARNFRPIRSEEDKAVEEMVRLTDRRASCLEEVCQILYRAGYRKED